MKDHVYVRNVTSRVLVQVLEPAAGANDIFLALILDQPDYPTVFLVAHRELKVGEVVELDPTK